MNQASLDGSDATVIASGVDTPSNALIMIGTSIPCSYLLIHVFTTPSSDGLAVDWINDNLYFSYAGSTSYHMAIYNITGGGNWEVIQTSNSRFYEIAVDPFGE